MRNLIRRTEKLEQRMQQRARVPSKSDLQCICYPNFKPPEVRFPILFEIAFMVKCSLHGDRFNRDSCVKQFYQAKWLYDTIEQLIYNPPSHFPCSRSMAEQLSGQYRKAHLAAFPPDLWPGVVEGGTEAEGGATFLRLKDGTRVQVSPGTDETKLVLAGLLKERDQIVDMSLIRGSENDKKRK
jgi:hypothetical protein